jgi:hypothetical protein
MIYRKENLPVLSKYILVAIPFLKDSIWFQASNTTKHNCHRQTHDET